MIEHEKHKTALEALRNVKAMALSGYHGTVETTLKRDGTPVTSVDKAIEDELRRVLSKAYPGDSFVGEERPARMSDKGLWIADPIDGTKAFASGSPLFGVLLGYIEDTLPILGFALVPVLDELWCAGTGGVTLCNGAPVATRSTIQLKDAIACATTPDMFSSAEWQCFDELSSRCRFRTFGGDCCNYLRLAAGKVDLVIESGLMPYDILPLVPIVQGAGGVITDWNNQPLRFNASRLKKSISVLASANHDIHRKAIASLNHVLVD